MKNVRRIAAGVASVAFAGVTVFIGGAALTGATAHADGNHAAVRLPDRPQSKALAGACGGKGVIGMHYRSVSYQSVTAGSTEEVEGSQWTLKGPKKGTDTVIVTLSSMAASGGAGELTSAALYKDGVGTSEGTKYFTYNNVLDQATVQFCAKIAQGQHTLAVRVTDGGGGATTLYYPTTTYERFQ
jgi:hypothetical protein